MKVITIEDWDSLIAVNGLGEIRTKTYASQYGDVSCPFVGIALGPNSIEGLVKVEGIQLQAGRVLPLRSDNYRIERVIGAYGGASGAKRLQLLLFECAEELACEVARPNHRFGPNDADIYDGTVNKVSYTTVRDVPFTGRRMARITIDNVANCTTGRYRITGYRWSKTTAAGAYALITTGPPLFTSSADGAFPVAAYIGGTDNAESWDRIVVEAQQGAAEVGSGTVRCEVETIGEIGVR